MSLMYITYGSIFIKMSQNRNSAGFLSSFLKMAASKIIKKILVIDTDSQSENNTIPRSVLSSFYAIFHL